MALLHLVLADADRRGGPPPTVALPVSVGRAVEAMCDDAGATLCGPSCRLPTSWRWPPARESASPPARRAATSSRPSCPPTTRSPPWCETLALLASSGSRLSEVVARLPAVRVAHEAVVTPWEKKGLSCGW